MTQYLRNKKKARTQAWPGDVRRYPQYQRRNGICEFGTYREDRKLLVKVTGDMCSLEIPWLHWLHQAMTEGRTQESKKAIRKQQTETELMDEETTIQRELVDGFHEAGVPHDGEVA